MRRRRSPVAPGSSVPWSSTSHGSAGTTSSCSPARRASTSPPAPGSTRSWSGVDAVVDTTNVATQKRAVAESFFGGVTRTLLAAEAAAGVGHHVVLSIVGIDDVDTGYYAGKRLQERLVAEGPVPWSVLRATQFHEFAEQALGFVRIGPFSLVPRMLTQPVAAREVAEALVDLAGAGPVGRAPELAGPEQHQLVDLAREVAPRLGRVVPVRMPGAAGRAMRSGALLPTDRRPAREDHVRRVEATRSVQR